MTDATLSIRRNAVFDAIVVGARCAGSPTAMLLARRGYRVLLLDRATFPSDTVSGHYLHQPGVAMLKRWGLFPRLREIGAPPIRQQRFDVGPFALVGSPTPAAGVADGYCPRRPAFDAMLIDAAVEAGAEFRPAYAVEGLLWDGDRVVGVRGRGRNGAPVEERARLVVGADGRYSRIAEAVRAVEYDVRPGRTCGYYAYFSGLPTRGLELYPRDGLFGVVLPTNAGLTQVAVIWPAERFTAVRRDVEREFMAALPRLSSHLVDRVRAARREEPFRGASHRRSAFRRPHGPGWALVGDAGYHKDPITAQGMSDALQDADLLAAAVDAALSGARPLGAALGDYERRRNARAAAMYDLTDGMARLATPSRDTQALFAALRENPDQTDRFLGVVAGTVSPADFFAPDNVASIVRASLLAAG